MAVVKAEMKTNANDSLYGHFSRKEAKRVVKKEATGLPELRQKVQLFYRAVIVLNSSFFNAANFQDHLEPENQLGLLKRTSSGMRWEKFEFHCFGRAGREFGKRESQTQSGLRAACLQNIDEAIGALNKIRENQSALTHFSADELTSLYSVHGSTELFEHLRTNETLLDQMIELAELLKEKRNQIVSQQESRPASCCPTCIVL